MGKRITLKDIAKAANVTHGTVSRALAGSDLVGDETRERIQKIAKELGYQMNYAARSIRTNRSRIIGVVVPNLKNPTFTRLAEGLHAAFQVRGYQMLLSTTDSRSEHESEAIATLLGYQLEGIVIVGSQSYHPVPVDESVTPAVYVFQHAADGTHVTVRIDDASSLRDATWRLLEFGHQRIALINGPGESLIAGFRQAHNEAGLTVDDSLIEIGEFSPAFGVEAIDRLLDAAAPPTAVILGTQPIWEGVLPQLAERGISIPQDLSVICREHAQLLEWWNPPIASIDTDSERVAGVISRVLFQRIDKSSEQASGEILVATKFTMRSSIRRMNSVDAM